jgi:2-polyprenyl-3-methyl-5-hydroxy-6-metoxy-1,4-benzoquinol methylase
MTSPYFVEREHCPVCRSVLFRERVRVAFDESPVREHLQEFYSQQGKVEFEYLAGAEYVLRECQECKLVYQGSIPGDALMERLYEHWIDAQYNLKMQAVLDDVDLYARHAQEVMQIVAWRRGGRSGLKVLDFGMGWAKWAMMAQAFGCDVLGGELSKTRIEFAKSHGIRVLDWSDLLNHRFDFINTEQVFEHLPNPLEMLCQLRDALAPGGLIKVSVPNGHDIERRLQRMEWTAPRDSRDSLMPVAPLEHINCFRRVTLTRLAREAGMAEVKMPLKFQYAYMTDWSSPKRALKNLLRPLDRNLMARPNYVFMSPIPEAASTKRP